MYLITSSLTALRGAVIQNNSAQAYAAGVLISSSSRAELTNVMISDNVVSGTSSIGGGLVVTESDVKMFNCVVRKNEALSCTCETGTSWTWYTMLLA